MTATTLRNLVAHGQSADVAKYELDMLIHFMQSGMVMDSSSALITVLWARRYISTATHRDRMASDTALRHSSFLFLRQLSKSFPRL